MDSEQFHSCPTAIIHWTPLFLMHNSAPLLFTLNASRAFGEKVGHALGVPLDEHEEREFEDGEHKSRPLVNVRGRDVFVVQSLYADAQQSVNDKLCRLLFFIGALRDASAGSVTAVVPYLCYARKDRKTQPRDPVTTRYVASLFEAVGTDRVVTLDVHNLAAFQNAFVCHTDHLEAKSLLVSYFAPLLCNDEVVVVSPDVGGVKRAELFRQALANVTGKTISGAFMEKQRSKGVVSGEAIVGEVKGKTALIIDDLISTGTTILRAAVACRRHGAKNVYAAASHGVFTGAANDVLANEALDKVIVTNTIEPFRVVSEAARSKLEILNVAPLFAAAIQCIHAGGSIVELLEKQES
jgi:ribose-phosphate pyrophosphokinase